METFYERVEDRIELGVGGRERKVEASWVDRTRRMTGTPFSFARRGEIETANRVRVGGGNKRRGRPVSKRDGEIIEGEGGDG